ncbi:NACHT domain-containing protein [Streptomyces spororaveus]|uniref:NACHT domain-containing protein n=1 Tax=Streptomyces spororaveus TaxID=284039 RepID=UPI003605D6A3
MNAATGTASGRGALAEELGWLQAELRRKGKTQKAAVEEANRRRRAAAGRSQDAPWPRKEGGLDLPVQTVNDWFPKQKGSKEPRMPQDFADLWSVVAVMLEWTGQLPDKPSAGRQRHHWNELHTDAQRGTSLDEQVRGYLQAGRKAAEQHPHPGIPGRTAPPSLAHVYVRQHSRPAAQGSTAAEPAEAVFRKPDRVCVLIAGPGGGKSTLLRTWLRDTADEWLGATRNASKSTFAVPVWVSAHILAQEEMPVADALAAATRKLSRFGRHPGLENVRFLERPCTGAHWQLLVDDLDELPNAAQRRAVLEKLANAVTDDPPLYRCFIATRPLTENELDVLDHVLGHKAPRYDLQPFTTDDLHTYIEKYFCTHWPPEEAARRAEQFTSALRSASLTVLAHTPLMAYMLCQLYLAAPDRPLPGGRTAVYEAFTDLIYENNQSKHVADSHEEAITHLVQSLQSPRARKEADQAARQAQEQLPELIDYLAYEWFTGQQAPAAATLSAHDALHRPGKVRPEIWQAFLEDLLRHTGLLVHHADGLGFPHQTFLEYHAARHATHDEQTRAKLLDQLFPPGQQPRVPALEQSSLGFLLDALLASPDGIAAETTTRLEALIRQEGQRVCWFLVEQVGLRTNLPAEPTARQLSNFAQNGSLDRSLRVEAASSLAGMDGYRDAGADRLIALADDTTLRGFYRVWAAQGLAVVDGYRDRAAQLYTRLADDTTLDDSARVEAASSLAGVDGYRDAGAGRLIALADDTTLRGFAFVEAASGLAGVDGYRDAGAGRLIALTGDTTLLGIARVLAAAYLSRADGCRDAGADHLIAFTDNTTLSLYERVSAAGFLSRVDGYRDAGAERLIAFADHTTLRGHDRVSAAYELAKVGGYRDAGAERLIAFADHTAFDGFERLSAARDLAGVDGYRDRVAQLYARLADDTTLTDNDRVSAARELAGVDGYRDAGADRLIALADNTTLRGITRLSAARNLDRANGYRDRVAQLYARLADDTTLTDNDRVSAARELAGVDGYRDAGADRLIAFADDTTRDGSRRVAAAKLAGVDGYRDAGAERLIAFADDTTFHGFERLSAARDLARVDGCQDRGDQLYTRLTDEAHQHPSWACAACGTSNTWGRSECDECGGAI